MTPGLNIGQSRTSGSLSRIPSSGTRDTLDLKVIINSKFVAIEIKNTGKRQSEVQKQYQKMIKTAEGIYIIVASLQGFYEWLNVFEKKGLENE